MGAVIVVMGIAEKKPAAEIWAMLNWLFSTVATRLTMFLPRSYPQNDMATTQKPIVSSNRSPMV
jgi:hypothetical protein